MNTIIKQHTSAFRSRTPEALFDLVVQDLLEEQSDEMYIEESDDDL